MKRCKSNVGLRLIVTIFTLSAGLTHARAAGLGDSMSELIEADWIRQDSQFNASRPAEPQANTDGVTTAQDAAGACDGIKNGRWGFHTASSEQDPWWQVDLQDEYKLGRIVVFNRTDSSTAPRTRNIRILTAGADGSFKPIYQHNGKTFYGIKEKKPLIVDLQNKDVTARIVRLHIPGKCSFALDEVEVYSTDNPTRNIALGKPADQKSTSQHSYPGTLGDAVNSAPPPRFKGTFELRHIREVVKRGKALLARLRPGASARRLNPLESRLTDLDARLARLEIGDNIPHGRRREIYLEARRLVRRIAFCNPLLDFDKLLFIKRHDSVGVFHMCDQYYGCNARPGGGLFVLSDPFGPDPKLTDVLENSVVERGRLAGEKLSGGAFLSPELSYDGKTILFAYTQAKAYEKYKGKAAYEWSPEISYHIFKVNADGSGLVQLTDGASDDFDPCFLPNGRIVFVTERRGGYLRCGRHCPVYTMYSMEPDGSDIICVSFHETHEWHPSVNNAGMLVYTRWDYVDRDTNIAHPSGYN